ncbi:MAG: PAS domain S-box protein [candidate division WOR-3 bacterium]|nr:MAG: PAS domain S-box protein [candidate division WOR-3 bacterium]
MKGRQKKRKARHKRQKQKGIQKQVFLDYERLKYLVSATSSVIYTAKSKGDCGATFVSDNVTRMVGYKPDDFLKKSTFWIDHLHPEDRKYVLSLMKKLVKEKKYSFEYRFRHKNGDYVWVRDEMHLVYDREGKPREIIGCWTDITQQKKTEKALQESSELLKKFMDSATEGFVLFDEHMNIIDVNDYILETFHAKKKDVIGMNALDLSLAAWETGRYDQYMRVLKTGIPCVVEDVVPPAQYGDMHVAVKVFKVGDGLGMIIRDITQEKRTEEKLQESEERFRTLYESVRAGVIVQEADGEITEINKVACDIFRVTENHIKGMSAFVPFTNLIDEAGEAIPDRENPFMITRRTGKPIRSAIIGIFPDDFMKLRWLLINTEPILDSSTGKVDAVIITFIDITERKEIEKALRESEERYRHIFEQSPIGIGIAALNGQVITANKAMQNITGYTLEEFRKINIANTYENIKERELLVKIIQKHGGVIDYHTRLKRKDGTLYDALLSVTRINIGGKDYFHTICQDISGRKKLKKRMSTHTKKKKKRS